MPRYFDFKVTLKDIRPAIWRRFLLPTGASFDELHEAIQRSFGWDACHLHRFTTSGRDHTVIAVAEDAQLDGGPRSPDERQVQLSEFFGVGPTGKRSCLYTYDFGDNWRHEVKLQQVVTSDERFVRRLLGGERAAPPEDCGGVGGYYRLVELVEIGTDPWEEDVDEVRDLIGDWRPDLFDLARTRAGFDR